MCGGYVQRITNSGTPKMAKLQTHKTIESGEIEMESHETEEHRRQAIERLRIIISKLNDLGSEYRDFLQEDAHKQADELLLEALRVVGAHKVAGAYEAAREAIGFYYS
jgi:hypothetical protein